MELSGKELATRLDVTPQSLSEAARADRHCQGYPVCDWARYDHRNWISHYDVPEGELSLLSGASAPDQAPEQPDQERDQPDQAGEDRLNPALADAKDIMDRLGENAQATQPDSPTVNASLVPHGTHVAASVSAGGASHVFAKAIEHDDSTVKVAGLTLVGAIGGYYLSDRTNIGTLIGGLLSFGISAMGEGWFQTVDTAGEDKALPGGNLSAPARPGDKRPANGQAAPFAKSPGGNAKNPASNGFSSGRSNGIIIG